MRLLIYIGIILVCVLFIDNVESKKSKNKKGIEGHVKEIKGRYNEKQNEKDTTVNKGVKINNKNVKKLDGKIIVNKKVVKRDVTNNPTEKNVVTKSKKKNGKKPIKDQIIKDCTNHVLDDEIFDNYEEAKIIKKQKFATDYTCNRQSEAELDASNTELEEPECNCQIDDDGNVEEDIDAFALEEDCQ